LTSHASAVEPGVSEDRLAKALNLDVRAKQRRARLDGNCPEVVDVLTVADDSVGSKFGSKSRQAQFGVAATHAR
jgi:hypothetical protein